MTAALGSLALMFGAAAPKKSNGSSTLIIIVLIGAAFYFLIYRPQQKKQKAVRAQATAYEVGDEVVTAGGIVGWVLDITDDRVTLETSVGASFTVLKPYVLRKLEPAEPPTDVVDGSGSEDHDHEGDQVHDHDHDGDEDLDHDHDPAIPEGGADDEAADEADHPASGAPIPPSGPPSGSTTTSGSGDDGSDADPPETPPII
jgi:preprotein translocase subunit YajC